MKGSKLCMWMNRKDRREIAIAIIYIYICIFIMPFIRTTFTGKEQYVLFNLIFTSSL